MYNEAIRRLVISFSNAERLEWAAAQFQALPAGAESLILAETGTAAGDFVRHAAPSGGGFLGAHGFTLRRLAASLAVGHVAPLSRLGLEAVAARSVYACRAEGLLGYFGPVADTPGFARALASTLSDLRLEAVSPEAVAATGAPGADLARLLTRYEQELETQSLADLAALYRVATESTSHVLLGLPLVLLDVVVDSTAARRFLAAVVDRAPSVIATAPAGDKEAVGALEEILQVKAEAVGLPPAITLDRLQCYVFAPDIPASAGPDASFDFFSAAGEGLEAVEIARRMVQLALQGTPFDRMAVLLRNPEGYLSLIEDALRRAAIPAWFSRSATRPDPAGRAFLALLACASEGLTASRFAEYLSLGQTPREPRDDPWAPAAHELSPPAPPEDPAPAPSAAALPTPFVWEKLLVDAAVIGGRDRWVRRLRGLEQQYRLRLAGLQQEGDPRREHIERELGRLETLAGFALPLIEILDSWPSRALWKDWLELLTALAGRALDDPEPVVSVLTELRPMGEVGPVTLDEVRVVLSECLGSLRPVPRGHRYGKVFVGSVEEARGRDFEVVFLPGLAEGLFPRQILEDPLLLDEARTRVGAGLVVEHQRVARERLLLQVAAGAARSKLVASYPRLDVTIGRPRVPSFYALELWRAAEGYLPDLPGMEKKAAQGAPSQLGWPAPVDTAQAIDDAEYDLAYLAELLREGRGAERGSSRYLLEANAHLKRSLTGRGRRWRKRWFDADGIVDADEATLQVLAGHSLRARSYSPTSLQHFAACPYRFLLHAVHQLHPREQAVAIEQLDPLERGSLFHDVQYELLRRLQASQLLPVNRDNLAQVLDLADQVLNGVAAAYHEKLAPAIEQVWRSTIEEIRTDLRGWVYEMVALHAEWLPTHFEYPYETVILDGFRVRGRMDLVERHHLRSVLRVTDHKTGKPPDPPPVSIGRGEHLQPALYGLAAEQMLGMPVESGVLFYPTQRGGYKLLDIKLDKPTRSRAGWALQTIDEAVRLGFLPAAPREDACKFCDYRAVCGPYEERRIQRKERDRLDPLNALRSQP